jgi:hypothetical protein
MANTVMPAKNFAVVLTATTPSTSASSPTLTDAFALGQSNQSEAYIQFTIGSLTNCSFEFQVSQDKTNWYSKPVLNVGGGSVSGAYYQIPTTKASLVMTQSQNVVIDIPAAYQWGRFAIFGSGTTTSSSVTVSVGSGAV